RKSTVLNNVKAFLKTCSARLEATLRLLDGQTPETIPEMRQSSASDIKGIIESLTVESLGLQKKDPTREIAELEQKLLDLRHRELLGQHLKEIEGYIQRLVWAKRAAGIRGSTKHITLKHNEMFSQLVTDRYIQLFQKTLKDLQRPLKVKVRTTGRKAEACKQIVLETDPTAPIEWVGPNKVLSEGEKRAVALADFLTEVALDTGSNGIVLDDPVTSLDLEWREMIACILAEEVNDRQVIVFTHDLPFLYFLKKHAERRSVDIATHWIKTGDTDGKPGYVFLNNSPALEREYRKAVRARELYAQAKNAPAGEQEDLLHQGFGALRTAYEAFIIFDLFEQVVMRFDERVSFTRLKSVAWDKPIADEVVEACERLSRGIEGHLHSDAFVAVKPTCAILQKEIELFDDLRKRLKKLKPG
ncbi:MAG: AAA family ATPase, partial [Candidatus Zixiibacteriota bacterium]